MLGNVGKYIVFIYLCYHGNCEDNAMVTGDISTTEVMLTTCGGGICVNGENSGHCLDNGATASECSCDVNGTIFFKGELCEEVLFNDEIVNKTTSARTANFTWPAPPNIMEERYRFVYRLSEQADMLDHESGAIYVSEFKMITGDTVRLTDLDSGNVMYIVCVMNESMASGDLSSIDSSMDNCLNITTKENVLWEYTLAAYIIGGYVSLTVVVLVILKLVTDRKYNRIHHREKAESIDEISQLTTGADAKQNGESVGSGNDSMSSLYNEVYEEAHSYRGKDNKAFDEPEADYPVEPHIDYF